MARKQLEVVRLERQPHRDAMNRLRLAYQLLMKATEPKSPQTKMEKPKEQKQEVT